MATKLLNKQVIRIGLFLIVILLGLAALYKQGKVQGTSAEVIGDLLFTYPGGTTPETLFNETDFKPGDCQTATVNVLNQSANNAIVGVFSNEEGEINGLSSVLTLTINNGVLYGPVSLAQFFTDSDIVNQINLLTLSGGQDVDLLFKVCFDDTDNNDLQGDSVVFDLNFGQIPPSIELPAVCADLEGIVTEVIDGTPGNDNIKGTTASELIRGFGGNDRIRGKGGHDCIIGGPGNDRIWGGSGNDIITGDAGEDRIRGGSGNDVIHGGTENDRINAGTGDDTVSGNAGNDRLRGSTGIDLIFGGEGADRIRGGSGADILLGEAGNDDIRGGSGGDFLDGGADTDSLNGNSGIDTCVGGESYSSCETII